MTRSRKAKPVFLRAPSRLQVQPVDVSPAVNPKTPENVHDTHTRRTIPTAGPNQSGEREIVMAYRDAMETPLRAELVQELESFPLRSAALPADLLEASKYLGSFDATEDQERELEGFEQSLSDEQALGDEASAAESYVLRELASNALARPGAPWDDLIPTAELTLECRVIAVVQLLSKVLDVRGDSATSETCWCGSLASEMVRLTPQGDVQIELDPQSPASKVPYAPRGDLFFAGLMLYEAVMEAKAPSPLTLGPAECEAEVRVKLRQTLHPAWVNKLPGIVGRALDCDAPPAWEGIAPLMRELRQALGESLPTPAEFATEVSRAIGVRDSRPTQLVADGPRTRAPKHSTIR